jgi:hypothetical protein
MKTNARWQQAQALPLLLLKEEVPVRNVQAVGWEPWKCGQTEESPLYPFQETNSFRGLHERDLLLLLLLSSSSLSPLCRVFIHIFLK